MSYDFKWKNNGAIKRMIVCGTRPEIIRLAAVMKRCRELSIPMQQVLPQLSVFCFQWVYLSNGFVEGTNSKLKMIKRTMYGRCGKELLTAKLILLNG